MFSRLSFASLSSFTLADTLSKSFSTALLACLLLISFPSHSALITEDLVDGSGDGLISRDDVTGLEWLDLTVTKQQSYNTVMTGTYINDLGFRYATKAEVQALNVSIGLDAIPNITFEARLYAGSAEMISKFGSTFPANWTRTTVGIFDSIVDGVIEGYRTIQYLQGTNAFKGYQDIYHVSTDIAYVEVGSFLVRGGASSASSSVPVPTSIALVMSCLLMLRRKGRAGFPGRTRSR